jgi:phage recombination protein Bet
MKMTSENVTPIVAPKTGEVSVHTIAKTELEVLRTVICPGANDVWLNYFLNLCASNKLNPLNRQAYLVPRTKKVKRNGQFFTEQTFTPQMGIDGLASIAQRSAEYAGHDPFDTGPMSVKISFDDWVHGKKQRVKKMAPEYVRVTVYRLVNGERYAFHGECWWDEYYPGEKGGNMWHKMPRRMLQKCAMAQALRAAFPEDSSGFTTPDEDNQAEPIDVTPDDVKPVKVDAKQLTDAYGEESQVKPAVDAKQIENMIKAFSEVLAPNQDPVVYVLERTKKQKLTELTEEDVADLQGLYKQLLAEQAGGDA